MPFDKTKFQPTVMPSFVEDYRTGDIVGYVKRDGSYGNIANIGGNFDPAKKPFVVQPDVVGGITTAGLLIISTSAPSNADGTPDGTFYIQAS